jgi:Domain of unknown function (DUF4376)
MIDLANWYWIVGGDEANVWSSARAASVPASDADYVAWREVPHQATIIASMDDLEAVFTAQYPPGMLTTYSVAVRDKTLVAGITVNGLPFATDALTVGSLNTAFIYVQQKSAETFSWKLPDGSFITLDKPDIIALQDAVSGYGQDCYACEDTTLDGLEAGTITTHAQIDAAFAAVQNTFTGLSQTTVASRRHQRK